MVTLGQIDLDLCSQNMHQNTCTQNHHVITSGQKGKDMRSQHLNLEVTPRTGSGMRSQHQHRGMVTPGHMDLHSQYQQNTAYLDMFTGLGMRSQHQQTRKNLAPVERTCAAPVRDRRAPQ